MRQQAVQRPFVVAGLLLSLASCERGAEQHFLRAYFDACALADDAAVATIALVTLDPRQHGVVGHFTVMRRAGVDPREVAAPDAARLSLPPSSVDAVPPPILEVRDVDVLADLHHGGGVRRAALRLTLARARAAGKLGRWVVVRLVLDGRTVPAVSSDRPSGSAR